MPQRPDRIDFVDATRDPVVPVSIDGWERKRLKPVEQKVVPVGFLSPHPTVTYLGFYAGELPSPYVGEHKLHGAVLTGFATEETAGVLDYIDLRLPGRWYHMVVDLWRDPDVQEHLYIQFLKGLIEVYPGKSDDWYVEETVKYVRKASTDYWNPSPHGTAAVFDGVLVTFDEYWDDRIQKIDEQLRGIHPDDHTNAWQYKTPAQQQSWDLQVERRAIMKMHGKKVNHGCPFDYGGPAAALDYYETDHLGIPVDLLRQEQTPNGLTAWVREAKMVRRLYDRVCNEAGASGYPFESWHRQLTGTQMGAVIAGLDEAYIGVAHLTPEHEAHERMRRVVEATARNPDSTYTWSREVRNAVWMAVDRTLDAPVWASRISPVDATKTPPGYGPWARVSDSVLPSKALS